MMSSISSHQLSARAIVALVFSLVLAVGSAAAASDGALEIDHMDRVGDLYTQVVTVESHGVRTLYVSGHVGRGETLREQSIAAYGNLEERLAKAGAKPEDVVKLVTYVVGWSADKADDAFAGFYEMYSGDVPVPAHTLVGAQALYSPHALIEVEAVAVVVAD